MRRAPLLALVLLLGACRGCPSSRPPIHLNPNMDVQPKGKPQAESGFFADGAVMRVPVAGTVAQGELREDSAWWTGKDAAGGWIGTIPGHADGAVLARGEQRYGIFCAPCHGAQGDGKGMLFQRAQVQSANLMEARFRAMPAGQIYDEMTNGFGLMPAYGPFIPVADRWAILAYLRKLQAETPVAESAAPAAEAAAAPGEPASPAAPSPAPDNAPSPAPASPGAAR